ncbi:MAG: DedA family protein [Rhodospirillales bacterium]|nr:DedA family protein [Rhodospirillales bacterium]
MLRRLYDRTMRLAAHRHALPALAVVSFVESSIFPIPPDVLMIPMCLADRRRSFWIATVCTVASVIGGFLGYAIGYYAFEAVGRPIIDFYGLNAKLAEFRQAFAEYGWWIIVIKGATPIPYKLITIAAGVAQFPLLEFAGASVISRGMRFYLVAALLWWFGEPIRTFIEKRLTLVTTVAAVLLVGGFIVVRYLF